ncbi:hypothetical protein L21SP3_01810 [Sedimentisphaera cyanobacteriorum]|uniref:UDP-2,3-diacylglucosamine pyrophosphatase LpxI n=1 Tax=Sedimentisphaera cyanobacteriorum TaxID=1940790 RepID=A0A1Q2HR98_9BACT|nr:UDP-2,3-diacylglucosamine diphosphatase LpxI [Sedimentisphaera cyanobacteriorum]AQQ09988.1 hypothetical protein L21SP3_01810 [Sedimentisphaera cyanobacteriorum]
MAGSLPDESVVGLIAGQGRLPFNVAEGISKAGKKTACVAIAGNAEPELADFCDFYRPVPISRLGAWIKWLRRFGARETIMVGRVAKADLHKAGILNLVLSYLPDWRVLRITAKILRSDWQDDTVLSAIADELQTGGITLIDSTQYSREHLADSGVMTRTKPGDRMMGDIEYGWNIVKKLGEFDVGQAIAVKNKEVIAVEAIEGTAEMIDRAGKFCRSGGWTLIKTAKPGQDMRFDVPCIGADTIKSLKTNKAGCVVVEAGKTFIIDKPETLAMADKLKIPVYGH